MQITKKQQGGSLLSVVAGMGIVAALVQGSLHYSAKSSSQFINGEKNKTLAMQMAEAGIEENIADLGSGTLEVTDGMQNQLTYDGKSLGEGAYTTRLTALGVSETVDTVQIVSHGLFGGKSHTIDANLKVNKYPDTVLTPILFLSPVTTTSFISRIVPETTLTSTQLTIDEVPPLAEQPAYATCVNSSEKKCDVCHIPLGYVENRQVVNISKSSIQTHFDHHGDYLTTDGTCDLYDSRTETSVAFVTVIDTVVSVDSVAVWDTVISVATKSKVKILSWK